MIYVILGMHKSGTTLVSQTLHASNINMGEFDESLTYDTNNKYERHNTQELNRDLLHGLLFPPLNYLLKSPFRPKFDQAGYRRNKDSIAIIRTNALRRLNEQQPPAEMYTLIEQLDNNYQDWGFKDPRTCLTYPLWRKALPEHKVIVVFRHYRELIRRYKAKDNLPRLYRVIHAWTMHNLLALEAVQSATVPTLVLSYENIMKEEQEYQTLEPFVGHALNDQRNPDLYRNRLKKDTPSVEIPAYMKRLLPIDPDTLYQTLMQRRTALENG